jgi:hypothetical protein
VRGDRQGDGRAPGRRVPERALRTRADARFLDPLISG